MQLNNDANPVNFKDLSDNRRGLKALGVQHGDMVSGICTEPCPVVARLLIRMDTQVYMYYTVERQVEAVARPETKAFGAKMTVADISARQFRLERQEKAHTASVSFDRWAAQRFQEYVASALAFNIKRGGIMYGTVDSETNEVRVEAIYEPHQEGTPHRLVSGHA